MVTDLVENKSFESKLKDKIRDSIGDLITNEDLSRLVHRSVEEIFFEPRKNKNREHWQSNQVEFLPPLLHDIVKQLLQPMVTEVIKEYISTHREEVLKVVETVVTNGVGNAVVTSMNTQFQNQLLTFQLNIQNQLNRT